MLRFFAVTTLCLTLLACASKNIAAGPPADTSDPKALLAANEELRRLLAAEQARAHSLEARLQQAASDLKETRKRLSRSANTDKSVLLERVDSLEQVLAELERVVEATRREAYLQGKNEMAAYLVENLEIRGESTSKERFLGADHYYSFEVWFANRRVVRMPVQTKRAEDPRSFLLSTAVTAASVIAGL